MCGLLIVVGFALLIFLPKVLVTRHNSFPIGASLPKSFPIDGALQRLYPDKNTTPTTLKKLAQGKNKGILVNFWSTWCPPCLEELPSLEYLNRQLTSAKNTHLPELITVSVDEKPNDVFALFKTLEFKPSFTVLYDSEGNLARSVGTTKFPETFWINEQGQILYKWVGPQDWLSRDVMDKIESLSRG